VTAAVMVLVQLDSVAMLSVSQETRPGTTFKRKEKKRKTGGITFVPTFRKRNPSASTNRSKDKVWPALAADIVKDQ
jgi:hypothetical protein